MREQSVSAASVAEAAVSSAFRPKRTITQNIRSFATRKPLGAAGAVVAIVLVLVAIFAPFIANHDPYEVDPKIKFSTPNSETYFGGDHLGRDVFSRVVYGARISLYVGLLSSFIGSTIGMLVGVAGVHFGGFVDMTIQRFVDGMMAFPALLLAIAIMAALGTSVNNVVIALSIIYIPSTARILRSQALAIKEMDYILAARAVGAGDWRVVIRHMIPNCFAVFIVIVTFHLGGAIIAEASLSFLGLGAPPNIPAWGGMLTGAATWIRVAWWVAIFPGAAIAIVVFAWNLLGDSLRDVLDPRLRGTE
jgi:peptide/nickel transport system permease protein